MEHRIESIEAVEATGPGALDGFAARCRCGYVMRTSLSRFEALKEGNAHVDYMVRKGEAR